MIINQVTFLLLRHTVQWYGLVMRETLLRYKLLTVFIIALLAPNLMTLVGLITAPANVLLSTPSSNYALFISCLLSTQFFALIWVMLHRTVISCRPWDKYLLSLRIDNSTKMLVDVFMLSIFNAIIWIPIVFDFFIHAHVDNYTSFILLLGRVLSIIGSLFFIQLVYLKKQYHLLPSMLIINALIVLPSIMFATLLQSILSVFSIFMVYVLISWSKRRGQAIRKKIKTELLSNHSSLFVILLQSLIENKAQLSAVLAITAMSLTTAGALLSHESAIPNIAIILSTLTLITALSISNLYKHIHMNWAAFANYTRSLPISEATLLYYSLLITLPIFFIANLPLLITIKLITNKSLFIKSCAGLIAAIIYLSTAYLPQVKGGRYGLFLSFLMMFIFVFIDYALINYLR